MPASQNPIHFSVICYASKSDAAIAESLASIQNQTVGFQRIQLILTGARLSETEQAVYTQYQQAHPNQVLLLSEPYETAAQAFNAALPKAVGGFVYFMETTDCISKTLFAKCLEAGRGTRSNLFLFPAVLKKPGSPLAQLHTLCRQYPKTEGLVDLDFDYHQIPVGVKNVIFPRQFLTGAVFQESLRYYSLQDFTLRILMDHAKDLFLVHGQCTYAVPMEDDIGNLDAFYKEWYFDTITAFCAPLLKDARQKFGIIPAFLQFAALYYTQWPFLCNMNLRNKNILLGDDLEAYKADLLALYQDIDDEIIVNTKKVRANKISTSLAKVLLELKHKEEPDATHYVYMKNNVVAAYEEAALETLRDEFLYIHNFECLDGRYELDVAFNDVLDPSRYTIYAEMNQKQYPLQPNTWYSLTKFFGVAAHKRHTFHVSIPLRENASRQTLVFYLVFDKKVKIALRLAFPASHARLAKSPRYSYWYHDHYLTYCKRNTIVTIPAKKRFLIKRELLYCINAIAVKKKEGLKLSWIRLCYWITRPWYQKQRIWLAFDKLFKAGDNGEYFYRYASEQKYDGIRKYYVINDQSVDQKRLLSLGYHPLKTGSLKHYLTFLNADIVFSTHASVFYHNFGPMGQYLRGLVKFENVTLQHGLTVQKLALSMNRVHDNLKRYYCASRYEIENLSRPIYGYSDCPEKTLKLTGVARYDGLTNRDHKEILITPTWRMGLVLPRESNDAPPPYNPAFRSSSYYRVYNQLINDPTLIEAAKKYGYRITYLVHPTVSIQIDDFDRNDYVQIVAATADTNYEKVLSEASLMVTDYSGVQFDFAYMRKPVVYYHHTDIPPHYEEGCFYYDTMAFGEICKNHDEMVKTLISYMEANCAIKPQFKARIDDFFAYDDHNNCERIYQDALAFQQEIDARKKQK